VALGAGIYAASRRNRVTALNINDVHCHRPFASPRNHGTGACREDQLGVLALAELILPATTGERR
jgi:hypothetical protein